MSGPCSCQTRCVFIARCTKELGMRPLQAHCHRGLGTLYIKTGRLEPARVELTIAIALYRAMEMTFWLPQAEAMLARVEGP